MKVHEIMTAHAQCVSPDNTLVEAAGLMRQLDVGALPVCDGDRIVGIVTDRDMVLRGTADGRDPNTTAIRDVMSGSVVYLRPEQEVEEAARLMEHRQIRRLPVVNAEERLIGIVSLGDIATSSNPAFSGMALRDVSEPREPNARRRRLAEQSATARPPAVPGETRRPASKGRSGRGTSPRRARGASTRKKSSRSSAAAKSRTTSRRSTRKTSRNSRRGRSTAGSRR